MADRHQPTRRGPDAPAPAWAQAIPVRIPPTSVSQYLTGIHALNLVDPDCPSGGDWHAEGSWFVPAEGRTGNGMEMLLANKARNGFTLRTPANLLGWDRLFDARPSLRLIGHPQGSSAAPVWAARHDRAIADGAWDWLASRPTGFPGPYDGPSVAKWLWTEAQFGHLHRLVRALAAALEGEALRLWSRWTRDLSPDADWEKGTHMRHGLST